VYCVNAIIVLSILLKNLYALFHFKCLKLTFGIRERLLALGDAFVAKGLTHFL
jgi:hypothetical protein